MFDLAAKRNEEATVPARVLLVDDDAQTYEVVKTRLQQESDIVVGWRQARGLDEVPDEEYAQTDVVVADSDKHGAALAEEVSRVRSRFNHLKFLLLGSAEDDSVTMILLETGARGYLDMQTSAESLPTAVRRLAAGGAWIPPHVLARYLDLIQLVEFLPKMGIEEDPCAQFTAREQRILMLMTCGRSNREIAGTLCIDEAIITAAMHQMMHRTGAVNRPSLIAYYLYHKLFRGDSSLLDRSQMN